MMKKNKRSKKKAGTRNRNKKQTGEKRKEKKTTHGHKT